MVRKFKIGDRVININGCAIVIETDVPAYFKDTDDSYKLNKILK